MTQTKWNSKYKHPMSNDHIIGEVNAQDRDCADSVMRPFICRTIFRGEEKEGVQIHISVNASETTEGAHKAITHKMVAEALKYTAAMYEERAKELA